jgi:hypothetical protein
MPPIDGYAYNRIELNHIYNLPVDLTSATTYRWNLVRFHEYCSDTASADLIRRALRSDVLDGTNEEPPPPPWPCEPADHSKNTDYDELAREDFERRASLLHDHYDLLEGDGWIHGDPNDY